ncbi:MAG: hypothetical protein ACYDA0_04910 [Candidatus Dormibacteraceae bacterium]
MFSVFQPYDDEGFHLLTLDGYVSGRALYSQLVSYHGPFFYEIMGAFFKLTGLEIANDSGRLVTLFIWLLASLAGGLVVYRLTRSLLLGLSSQLLTFNLLVALTSEPMQPGGLLSLVLIGLTLVAAYRSRWPRATAAFIGALVAAACLVKINVGAFAVMAVAFAFAGSLTGRWRRLLLTATGLILTVAPLALMLRMLDRDWVINYAVAAAFAAAALTIAVTVAGPERVAPPALRLMIGSGSAVAIVIIGVAVLGGTRLFDLANSLVLVAYRQPLFYVQPLNVKSWVVVSAAASLGLAIAVVGIRTGRPTPTVVPATARIAAGVLMWICIVLPPSYLLMLAVPLVWVAALAPRDDQGSPTDGYARLLLPALAVMESLQAYPVAGSQVSIASLGVVPVGAIALNDGVRQLRAWAAGRSRPRLVGAANKVPLGALIISLAATSLWASVAVTSYVGGSPLGLPGARLLRLAPTQQVALRSLTTSVRRDCTSFVTMPGMPSLYIWTGQQAPVPLFETDWMYLLDSAQQQSIVDRVRTLPGMCVVRNDAVVKFWAEGRPVPRGPLIDFIDTNFVISGSYGDYDLLVQR